MTLVRSTLMGNGRWWSWDCPECERFVAVQAHSGEEPPEELRGFTPCPFCGERTPLDHPPN